MPTYNFNSSIEEIAAGLAHEVKNPLSLVKANIDLLELGDTQEGHAQSYRIMRREIERINDLLLNFIQFSKPLEGFKTTFSLSSILYDLVDELKSTYKVEFTLTIDKNDIVFYGDEDGIRRVMLNVLKNAIEAMDKDCGVINISLSQDCRHTVVKIQDNGKGLSKQDADKAFKPFYTTKQGGSGLGLHLCKAIIEEHGGEMTIDGKEGSGCTVTLMLPIQ